MAPAPKPHIVHLDTQAPAFKSLDSSLDTLWPPLHQFVPVLLRARLVDLLDSSPDARVVGVSSNEPDGGHSSPDWKIIAPMLVLLRAERSAQGTGRVYTINVEGKDNAGNVTSRAVTVNVPLRLHR